MYFPALPLAIPARASNHSDAIMKEARLLLFWEHS
jgi:hypothetical protein